MTNSKHTPGPWFANKRDAGYYNVCVSKSYYAQSIASVMSNEYIENNDMEADARLIAAAPDLLAVLSEIIAQDNCNYDRDTPQSKKIWQVARQVLARAKGEI